MAIQVTGTVRSIKLKTRAPYHPNYNKNSSVLEFYADVELETEEDVVYFKTPAVTRRITNGGPFAVVHYSFPAKGNKFLVETGEHRVASPGKPNDNVLKLTVKAGDTITVDGRLKANKTSQKGNKYRSLTHVALSQPCHVLRPYTLSERTLEAV